MLNNRNGYETMLGDGEEYIGDKGVGSNGGQEYIGDGGSGKNVGNNTISSQTTSNLNGVPTSLANVKSSKGNGLLLKSAISLIAPKLLIDKLLIGHGYIDKLLISCGYMPLSPENANSLKKAMNMMMWGGIAYSILWLVLRLYDFGSLAYKLGLRGALHEIYDRFRKTCNRYWLKLNSVTFIDKLTGHSKRLKRKLTQKTEPLVNKISRIDRANKKIKNKQKAVAKKIKANKQNALTQKVKPLVDKISKMDRVTKRIKVANRQNKIAIRNRSKIDKTTGKVKTANKQNKVKTKTPRTTDNAFNESKLEGLNKGQRKGVLADFLGKVKNKFNKIGSSIKERINKLKPPTTRDIDGKPKTDKSKTDKQRDEKDRKDGVTSGLTDRGKGEKEGGVKGKGKGEKEGNGKRKKGGKEIGDKKDDGKVKGGVSTDDKTKKGKGTDGKGKKREKEKDEDKGGGGKETDVKRESDGSGKGEKGTDGKEKNGDGRKATGNSGDTEKKEKDSVTDDKIGKNNSNQSLTNGQNQNQNQSQSQSQSQNQNQSGIQQQSTTGQQSSGQQNKPPEPSKPSDNSQSQNTPNDSNGIKNTQMLEEAKNNFEERHGIDIDGDKQVGDTGLTVEQYNANRQAQSGTAVDESGNAEKGTPQEPKQPEGKKQNVDGAGEVQEPEQSEKQSDLETQLPTKDFQRFSKENNEKPEKSGYEEGMNDLLAELEAEDKIKEKGVEPSATPASQTPTPSGEGKNQSQTFINNAGQIAPKSTLPLDPPQNPPVTQGQSKGNSRPAGRSIADEAPR